MAAEPAAPVTSDGRSIAAFRVASRIVQRLTKGLLIVCGVIFCVALAALTLDIGMRVAFGASVRGVQEIVSDLFLYAFFLGAAALYARNEDVALGFFVRMLPIRWRALLALTTALAIAGSMAVVCYETVVLAIEQHTTLSADLGIPESVRLTPLALATAVIACTSLVEAWSCLLWAVRGARPVLSEPTAAEGQGAIS
jgi:TRAP-type C4-dicarboxylate transport system permease small subunit